MNEADWALIGVGDAQLRRAYADRVALHVRASKAMRMRRLLSYHPADGTVEVHRQRCNRNLLAQPARL